MNDVVYTNIGAIVVALNPFNFKIPHYMDDQMPKYLAEGPVIEKNIPHSWAQVHNKYNEMISMQTNECILISGGRRPQNYMCTLPRRLQANTGRELLAKLSRSEEARPHG
jgi:hypothetical protein